MLAVLSPAKKLDFAPASTSLPATEPVLMKDARSLMRTARGLSQKKLAELMKLSADLAKLNYDRYRRFELPFTEENALQSVLAFNGDVYQGLQARTLSEADLVWAQERVGILSGMFGLLRPLDLIQPHRLEMGTRLETRRGSNLYQYWGDLIVRRINQQVADHRDPTLINLASGEYFKAVRLKKLKTPTVAMVFEEYVDGKPKVLSFLAKKARGMMARYMIEHRVETPQELKAFDADRYAFEPGASTAERWVFRRKFIPVAEQR